jgi:outer membrane lipoprotein
MKLTAVLFCITLFFQGCTYAISPNMVSRADNTITFDKLQVDPVSFKDKIVIFGGTISRVTTLKQGSLIEVLQKPLDYWGQPERTKRTGGRFLAFHTGYLNTLAYAPGIDITIAGEVLGTGIPMIGDTQYDYPVILVKELKLWGPAPRSQDKPQWMDPLYDPSSSVRPK